MVTPVVSVISRLLPVASPQLVRTTFLVSCHLSTPPDLETPLVEARPVLSAALLQQLPPRLHLLMSAAFSPQAQPCLRYLHQLQTFPPRLQMLLPQLVSTAALLTQTATSSLVVAVALHQHSRSAVVFHRQSRSAVARSVYQHRPLAARMLKLRPRLWTSTVTTRLSLLLLPVRAVSRPQLLRARVPQYQVPPAFLRAPWLRLQIAHTLLACLVPLGHLRRQAVRAQVLHQSRLARVLLLLRLLPARVLAVLRLILVRVRFRQLSLARALALLRLPLARVLVLLRLPLARVLVLLRLPLASFLVFLRLPLVKALSRHLSLVRVPVLPQSRPLRAWLFPLLCLARVSFPRLAPPVFSRAVLRASHLAVLKASHPA